MIEITTERVDQFVQLLYTQEKARATIQKYLQAVRAFAQYLDGEAFTKEKLMQYREELLVGRSAQTVNIALTAINAFSDSLGAAELRVKYLKTQRKPFLEENRELSREEYRRLLAAARERDTRLYFLAMTLGSTGIRISELPFITVEAVKCGRARIYLKGKCRTILLPTKLCRQLLLYCKKNSIGHGIVFRTRSGKPLDRSNICHSLKRICGAAKVDPRKVFPHNFRHLFARTFYAIEKNLAHLADILGHSRLETTRIYIAVSVETHRKILDKMKLLE